VSGPHSAPTLRNKGGDVVSFIDESFLTDLGGYLVDWLRCQCAHFQFITCIQFNENIRKGKRNLRVVDGNEVELEGVGNFGSELPSDFSLQLDDILYVPNLKINLISISALDYSRHICEFGNNKCNIKYHNINVGLGYLQGKLYILSFDKDYSVMNVSDVSNKRKRNDETSSKLWHCYLGRISRGRMEHLVREEILHSLDFWLRTVHRLY
jgi:hypothetical protein